MATGTYEGVVGGANNKESRESSEESTDDDGSVESLLEAMAAGERYVEVFNMLEKKFCRRSTDEAILYSLEIYVPVGVYR